MKTLEIKKREFLKAIDSEETLDKLQKYLIRIKQRSVPPCQFTIDELKEELRQSKIDAKNGLGISQEEMRKRPLPA